MKKPKIVVICGSSRFVDVMAVCAWLIERDEKAIAMSLHLLPQWYPDCPDDHLAEHEGVALEMDELHLRKIDMADEIFVVNKDDYIGDSTAREIGYAKLNNKPVRWYSHDPIGDDVRGLIDAKHNIRCNCPEGEEELVPEHNVCITCGKPAY